MDIDGYYNYIIYVWINMKYIQFQYIYICQIPVKYPWIIFIEQAIINGKYMDNFWIINFWIIMICTPPKKTEKSISL
jgi:hypothetical protein